MRAQENTLVTIEYDLYDADEGELIASTKEEGEPVVFLMGHDMVVEGLESALRDKEAGHEFDVTVEPENGYGEYDDDISEEEVDIEELPDDATEGDVFFYENDEGPQSLVVVELNKPEGVAIVDLNHPLAGVRLRFKGRITDVRMPTEEELQEAIEALEQMIEGADGDDEDDGDHDHPHDHGRSHAESAGKGGGRAAKPKAEPKAPAPAKGKSGGGKGSKEPAKAKEPAKGKDAGKGGAKDAGKGGGRKR